MEKLGEFSCPACSMGFRSLRLLEKHKALFCIGNSIGDPVVLRQGQPERTGIYPEPAHTPDLIRFHKLRMSIEESMPNLPKWPTEAEGLEVKVLGRQWGHRERLRKMAKQHDCQLAEIQAHNPLLEQQRVDAMLRVLRLASGLYSGGQEVGRPTPLLPVQCQPGGASPYSHTVPLRNYAPLAVKQPMPRHPEKKKMQPSPSLSLVVELQAAGGLDAYGQEVQRLVSQGWARLEFFDQHNQFQSG
ncbi:unnamed protein product [Coregonus sp. 'balchen']|nr:unnamed protein product [Coregonus sp. 'balchen']